METFENLNHSAGLTNMLKQDEKKENYTDEVISGTDDDKDNSALVEALKDLDCYESGNSSDDILDCTLSSEGLELPGSMGNGDTGLPPVLKVGNKAIRLT